MDMSDLPVPLSRIEKLWNCLITEEAPDFEPLSRNEKYLMAMLDRYDISNLPAPMSRGEKLLYKIAVGETDLSDVPGYLSRYEELLKYLIENGGISGGDFEYVLYTLNQSLSTLYTTEEKPVKSAILKGNTDENLQSVKMPVLTITGKNLFDGELEKGGLSIDTGLPNSTQLNRHRSKNYTKVKSSTKYAVYNNYSSTVGIREFDEDYNLVSWSSLSSSYAFTTSNKTKYLKFIINNTNDDNLLQLEEGSVATQYEPFKSNILTVNEDVTFRSNGDICDELNLLTRQLTQRIGEDGAVLSQEVVKTVDLTVVDQDNQPTELGTFENVTYVSLEAENLIPEVEMEVATRISEELASASPLMDDISTKQEKFNTTIDEQSENVDATMIATTEIYEEIL